jgi:hypothetical protein
MFYAVVCKCQLRSDDKKEKKYELKRPWTIFGMRSVNIWRRIVLCCAILGR